MFNQSSALIVLLVLFACSTHAENLTDTLLKNPAGNLNYRYLSIGYVDYDTSGNGIAFVGSFEIKENIAMHIYVDNMTKSGIDSRYLGANVFIHRAFPKLTDVDLFYGAGLRKVDSDTSRGSITDSGVVLTLGARKEMDPDLEFNAKVAFETVGASDIEFGAGVIYEISDVLHFQGEYIVLDDDNRLGLGVRYYLD